MEVGFGLETSIDLEGKIPVIASIEDACTDFFHDKDYNGGLENLTIGMLLTKAGEDLLHPVRPFEFHKRVIINVPPFPIKEMFNCVSYDLKPDYNFVLSHDGEELRNYLCTEIYKSTEMLLNHADKYPTFDVPSFRADLKRLLIR